MSKAKPRTELQALFDQAAERKRIIDKLPARFETRATAEIERMRREVPGLVTREGDRVTFKCGCSNVFSFRPSVYPPSFFGRNHDYVNGCPCCEAIEQRILACHKEVMRWIP